jgi:nucleotide-binding universal stress UspA family protein
MYPFRRILIPTDFSTASEWAFDEALRLASDSNSELLVVHVRRTWKDQPEMLRLPADPSLYEYAENHELSRLRDRVRRAHASLETRMLVTTAPRPAQAICDVAKREKADVIVIATHGRHHVAHILIGSTTLGVIEHPPVPILAIRYGIRKRERLGRLVVPVHPKQTTRAALELSAEMARSRQSEVHLLTICGQQDRASAETHMQAIVHELEGIPVVSKIVTANDVEREVIRYTAKANGDVIMLNGGGEFSELKAGIVRHAPVPVMIVP